MNKPSAKSDTTGHASRIERIKAWCIGWWKYCSRGVWGDTRTSFKVNLIKTLNLSVRSFLSADLQSTACALTYRMLLAIVPALALLFAIGRGFGFQNLLTSQLFGYFPSQQKALEAAFRFVDAYLAQASEGLFVGVGILFLLWTLISLVSSVEDAFNRIWGVKYGRSFWRKITDYTAIFLILPVLMICSSGLSIFMSTTLQEAIPLKFMSPAISAMLDCATIVLTCLFFTGAYMLIPNTTVKFKNALMSGILAGLAFQILQWLFVTGQLYVSKYNAIYGGFAFLPLLLIWMQLVWVICLSGAVLCYSSQNIFRFSFTSEVTDISILYRRKITLAIMAVVARRFKMGLQPLRSADFVAEYNIPTRLVEDIVAELADAGLLARVMTGKNENDYALQPATDITGLTVGRVVASVENHGASDFIPGFASEFKKIDVFTDNITGAMVGRGDNTPIADIAIDLYPDRQSTTDIDNQPNINQSK